MRRQPGNTKWAWRFLKWGAAVLLCVIVLLPIWWMCNVVFSATGTALSLSPRLYPTSIFGGLQNISDVLAGGAFVSSLLNSTLYATLSAALVVLLASAAAYEFAHHEFPGRHILYALCLIGLMLPLAVIVIPAQRIVAGLGWLNTIKGIVVPTTASTFALFFLTEYMRILPKELIEAAKIDGANHVQIFWSVALPVAKTGVVTVAILTFISNWASYLWPLVVASNSRMYPVSLQVAGYFATGAKYPTNIVMTAALLSAIPVVLFYVIFNRLIVQGIARSGLTG
jgi:multiple sugar transport system permease protein